MVQAVGLGVVVSFFFMELTGLSAGGLVVPGYLAFFWDNPLRIAVTMLIALATYGIIRLLANYVILFSRRRFLATVLVGLILGYLLESLVFQFPTGYRDLQAIGYIIPGLIANDMLKQGIINTVSSTLLVSLLVRLIIVAIF